MSKNYSDEEFVDNDPTDELPILTDVVETLGDDQTAAMPTSDQADDTGRHATARLKISQPIVAPDLGAAELERSIADRDARLRSLEQELGGLEARWRATSAELAAREATIDELRAALAEAESGRAADFAATERIRLELEARDARIAELSRQLTTAQSKTAALESNARTLEQQIAELEAEEASRPAQPESVGVSSEIERLRAEVASLTQHIENRNTVWRRQTAELAEKTSRIAELELELEQRLKRQQAAEDRADSEAERVRELRARLAATAAAHEQAVAAASAAPAERSAERPDKLAGDSHRLRQELKKAFALQLEAVDDPAALGRLEDLENAIRELEQAMDGTAAAPPEAARREPAQLVCLTEEALGPFRLEDGSLSIGRGGHCEIRIMTHYVSREHARIVVAAGRCTIEDAGSRNGVFVNSVRIERQELQNNDLVTIGDTQFRYQASESGATLP